MRCLVALIAVFLAAVPSVASTGRTADAEILEMCFAAFDGAAAFIARDYPDRSISSKVLAAHGALMSRVTIEWLRGYYPALVVVESPDWDSTAVFAGTPLGDDIRGMGICVTDSLIRGLAPKFLEAALAHETAHLTSGMPAPFRQVQWEHQMDSWAVRIVGRDTVLDMLRFVLEYAPQLRTGTDAAESSRSELIERIRLLIMTM